MKKSIEKLSMLFIAMVLMTSAIAQVSTYERQPGYYTLGLNGGFAYQDSDVPAILDGYGFGLTIGKNIFYQPGSGLSFDIRGRGLYTKTYGMDYLNSTGIEKNQALNGTFELDYTKDAGGPGYVYHNHQTDHVELGLEGVVNFNKLRENTNVILSLFGGVGLDWYNTRIDQADANGSYADAYASLDDNASTSFKKRELKNAILDGRYETLADGFDGGSGKLGIMPALGVELGYQLTPTFSMGVGHKVTFTKTDDFDGQQWNNNNNLTGDNDIHHYTNLHMRWVLNDQGKKLKAPVIKITNPGVDPYTTRDPNMQIKANIKHINSSMDVDFTVNGRPESFNFNKEKFNSYIRLEPGRNDIAIFASNTVGSDRETVTIYYEAPVIDNHPQGRRPTVNITNPPYDDFRTEIDRFNVKATIHNVFDERDILFIVDGRENRNFEYNNRSKAFNATIDLYEGRNEIRIEARNDHGSDSDAATIYLEDYTNEGDPSDPPVVTITSSSQPTIDPFDPDNCRSTVIATVLNIEDENQITLLINGGKSYDFNFNVNTQVLQTTVPLESGYNEVVIIAENEAGSDEDRINIEGCANGTQEQNPPVVTITQPGAKVSTTNQPTATVKATVLHIDRKSDINFIFNGRNTSDFSFNASTKVLTATVSLEKGNNRVEIIAQNKDGQDADEVNIYYEVIDIEPQRPPKVDITTPRNNSSFDNASIEMTAMVSNIKDKNAIKVYLNGRTVKDFTFSSSRKQVSANLTLTKGNNTIRVTAGNADGNDEDQVNVRLNTPAPKLPEVAFTKPSKVNSTSKTERTDIAATVKNVSRNSDIVLTVNGTRIQNFNYLKGQVSAQIKLQGGSNHIVIKVSNQHGNDQDKRIIQYHAPAPKLPEVTFTKPSKVSTTTKFETADIAATVKNVTKKSGIIMTLNGHRYSDFNFRNGQVTAKIKLRSGNNEVVIKATNDDGTDQDQRSIQYTPIKPPTVKITTPAANSTTDVQTANIKAKVTNIENKDQVVFIFNGRQISNFNLNRNEISAKLTLAAGKNKVTVKVSNKAGNAEDSRAITYRLPVSNPPAVSIVTPKNKFETDKDKVRIQSIIRNVSGQKGVQLIVNGKSTRFSFNRGELNAEVNLQNDKNTITVKGENADGKDEASVIVFYKKAQMPKPTVRFTAPSRNGTTVKSEKYTLKAVVKNVKRKENISVKLNGAKLKGFSYNAKSGEVSATVTLKEGENQLMVVGKNASGEASANTSVKYAKLVVSRKNPPSVKIISVSNPTVDPFDPNSAKSTILASLDNISTKGQIKFTVNGKPASFDYKAKSGQFQATVNLKKGKTTIKVFASNKDGSDEETRTIRF